MSAKKVLSKTSSNSKEDSETFITIWLDADVNVYEENRQAQQKLRTATSYFKTFEKVNECEKYIQSISPQQPLTLIVSGLLGKEIVPQIHNLHQIVSIYVFCYEKDNNEQWTIHFPKIKAVINRLDKLISRIKIDQKTFLDAFHSSSIFVTVDTRNQTSTYSNPYFAYSQLLTNVLLQLKPNETDKNDLISLYNDIYKNSQSDLEIIHEFEHNYNANDVLWWYNKCPTIYKIFNNALKTQDINRILLFQFFIHDLNQQLTKYQCQSPIRVFRSQIISYYEIRRLYSSVGQFVSMNTFLLTVLDYNFALESLAYMNSNDLYRVVLDIKADPNVVTTKNFADISEHYLPKYRQVLFSIGSIFRVTSVEQSNDQLWIVRMTLCSDNNPHLKFCFQQMKEKYKYYNNKLALFSFSRVLRDINKIDEAEKYCQRLLHDLSDDESSLNMINEELAVLASIKDASNSTKQSEQKSIEIFKETDSNGSDSIEASNNTSKTDSLKTHNMDSFILENSTENDNDANDHDSGNNFRFIDVAAESHHVLLPIEGHEKMPLVTLEEAVVPLLPILPDIRRKVHTAKQRSKNPPDGLTPDQSAAIMLYTMEWEPKHQCLYYALNTQLRTADRKALKPWFLYLKLILTALSRLPSIERTVYRGVKLNLSSKHPEGEEFFWWGFSSCTTTINVLKSNQFLGKNGIRTLFHIECKNGKDIRSHSYYQKEDEILLLPATYLKVISCFEMAPGLHTIQLKELQPEFLYLEPVV